MHVPLLDLRRQYQALKGEILAEIEAVAESQQFILGTKVEQLEETIASFCGARHAIGVSSGTDAELVLLMALGVGPGDAVLTSAYTFFATAGSVARLGARPQFVDIDPDTFNLSPIALRSALEKTPQVKAILPVHLFGQCADMDAILELGREYDVAILEDAAQTLGANHPRGSAGAISDAGWFSFYPTKNLGAFGDAGMIVCNDDALAARIRALRNHGMETRYFHKWLGGNFRLDAIQAAVLGVKLPYLRSWSAQRRDRAEFYRSEFARCNVPATVQLPVERYAAHGISDHHVYNQFVIRAPRRESLREHLAAHGVATEVYYPLPLHLQECFRDLGYRAGDFPEAERAAVETVALPIFPEITSTEQRYVVEQIAAFYSDARATT